MPQTSAQPSPPHVVLSSERVRFALADARLTHWLAINPGLPAQLAQWLNALFASPHNLTGVRDPELALSKHALESLRGWNQILNADLPVPHGPLIDIGSGNGAPGLPIALAEANREATLLDSRASAAEFLEHVRAGDHRIQVRAERAELVAHGKLRESFAVALTRAAAPPPVALELCLPLLNLGGLLVAWTGPLDRDTLRQLDAAAAKLGAIRAPIHDAPELLVAIKIRPTDHTYPRRWPAIRRAPLGSGRS